MHNETEFQTPLFVEPTTPGDEGNTEPVATSQPPSGPYDYHGIFSARA
ncbi:MULTISPECIES: hypothetical protein [Rhodococcus]|jgi:hypothetical protein|uniref:Uncharacterized protein n=1 Tax=Rhodococcus aetherivorans TaxID=191292 RepID=N1M6Z8_9NOCA|nr:MULTISPECIES: hypothetical protein [Rhodococcus]ETT25514.1 hypothetical protein RR21198_3810 [Rhodococcus rhodochrous ATCC 21198]NCL77778.1 hypothetical protein [Rhodococcus sp. YH1]MBC2591139.1 hypothetical protein [Rhodococcus aetherivorans]MDV6292706.1 hypothetical protein [Rhodococcus aetherivorans]NGP05273.1 hypothetical protein [Rhodococcus sp. 14C212]